MDSFYEVPRCAPKPTSVGSISSIPVVPEVSMIYQTQTKSNEGTLNDSMYLSYKAWKEHSQNKAVSNQNMQDSYLGIQNPIGFYNSPTDTKEQLTATTNKLDFTQKVQPFEEIYMANIPNRHLDLSMIGSPKLITKKEVGNVGNLHTKMVKKSPVKPRNSEGTNCKLIDAYDYDTWCSKRDAFDKLLINDSNQSGVTNKNQIIDLYNYEQNRTEPKFVSSPFINNYYCKLNTTDHKCKCKEVNSDSSNNQNEDVSVKDLLKIIQQQNEQLLNLQKQVATLINNKDSGKEALKTANLFEDQCKTSTQVENNSYNKQPQFYPKKGPLHQISLDVMTSFELSIRRPTNPKICEGMHHHPKICEVTENEPTVSENFLDGIARPGDAILSLNEPQLQVPERCPTPAGSIQIDMKDYSSDSSSEEEERPYPEWTFYNNIMTQVNHILKKSGICSSNTSSSSGVQIGPGDVIKQNMMKKVKETTIKHLKSIGVHVPPNDIEEHKDGNSNGSEISFAVQQLLMKYLPSDHLAKVSSDQNNFQKPKQTGRIKRRPEFSMATVQYMQKYNLLNDNHNYGNASIFERENFDRILDTTAIRQQPKLL